eukprot:3085789-Rhodomonas_salina.2
MLHICSVTACRQSHQAVGREEAQYATCFVAREAVVVDPGVHTVQFSTVQYSRRFLPRTIYAFHKHSPQSSTQRKHAHHPTAGSPLNLHHPNNPPTRAALSAQISFLPCAGMGCCMVWGMCCMDCMLMLGVLV